MLIQQVSHNLFQISPYYMDNFNIDAFAMMKKCAKTTSRRDFNRMRIDRDKRIERELNEIEVKRNDRFSSTVNFERIQQEKFFLSCV